LLAAALTMQSSAFISAESIVPMASNRSIQQGIIPIYRIYQCQDDWLFLACGNPNFWNKLCIALGRDDLAADPRFEGAPWAVVEEEHRDALTSIMAEILRERPRAYWLQLFAENDVPCAPVSRREEFMEDPQVKQNQIIVEIDDPRVGKTRQMGIPVTLVETPGRIKGPAPRLGEHTSAILGELGYGDDRIGQFRNQGII